MPRKTDLDPSLAYTVLLEFEWFRRLALPESTAWINALLEDWYASAETSMYVFGMAWGREQTGAAG